MITLYKSLSVLVLVSVAFTSHIMCKYFRKREKKKHEINEVMMFSPSNILIKSKYSQCPIPPSMDRLLYYLHSPRFNIDICMYVMTNTDLVNAIIKLSYRNINIRVILDAEMAFCQGSLLKRLQTQKIPLRWLKSTNLMHHKFCLIDTLNNNNYAMPLVIAGSLNWTNQALSGNWEDVIVTSQTDIVERYKVEFEKLWLEYKPIVDMDLLPAISTCTCPIKSRRVKRK